MLRRRWLRVLMPLILLLWPSLTHADMGTFSAGQPLSHSVVNSFMQTTDLIGDLRGFVGTTVPASDSGITGSEVAVRGLSAVNDGLGGIFYWNATSTASDDGLNVIKPTAVSGAGRWLRLVSPVPSVAVSTTGTIAVQTAAVVHWTAASPAASATFQLTATPTDNGWQEFDNDTRQYTYPMIINGNGKAIGAGGDTQIKSYMPGPVFLRYSAAAGYWSVSR